jgi:hypothetical protein
MDGRNALFVLVIAGNCAGLVGCVTIGRPLPERGNEPTALASAQDVPLVPIPPPPVGTPEETKESKETKPPVVVPPPTTVDIPPPVIAPPATIATTTTTSRELYQSAVNRYQTMDSYIVRLIRREVVKGEMQPEEVMLFKFRKEPWSLYFKWLGKEGQGREVVYVKGRHEGKIHSLLAAGDIPLMPAGKRMALAPDNMLVKSATRHPITEAGLGAAIDRIGRVLTAIERGDAKAGTMNVVGPVSRPEFEKPVLALEHTMPAGHDASLPKGGKRTYYMDPVTNLPMLITAKDERGQDVEYYRHDRLQAGVKLDDTDFDPEKLWAKTKTASAATE